MKANTYLLLSIFTVLSAISCSKGFEATAEEENPTTGEKISYSIIASIDDLTKGTVDPILRVTWTKDDEISVLDLTNKKNLGTLKAEATGTEVKFSGDITKPAQAECIGYVYPAISAAPKGTVSTGVDFASQSLNGDIVFCASAVDSNPGETLGNKNIKFTLANAFIDVSMTNLPKSTDIGELNVNGFKNSMSWEFSTTSIDISTTDATTTISLTPTTSTTVSTSAKGYYMFSFACPPSALDTNRYIKVYKKETDGNTLVKYADLFSAEVSSNNYIGTVTACRNLFSVAADRYVEFSKGNLQAIVDAKGVATTWQFASAQYTALGNTTANALCKDGTIDLFGWSTDGVGATSNYKAWGIDTSSTVTDYAGTFVDWGTLMGDGWRTLTKDEWVYLISDPNNDTQPELFRDDAKSLRKYSTVNGIKCLVIAPDNHKILTIAASYTSDEWAAAEKEGLVCLPYTGYRNGDSVNATTSQGNYWSSTNSSTDTKAFVISITSASIDPKSEGYKKYGRAVRLVRE